MEVELGELESQVAQSSRGHQAPFHVARVRGSANHDIFLVLESPLQPVLFLLVVRVESCGQLNLFIPVSVPSKQHGFAVAGIRNEQLSLVHDRNQNAGADVSHFGVAHVEGSAGEGEPLSLDLVDGLLDGPLHVCLRLGLLQPLLQVHVQLATGVVGDLPTAVAVEDCEVVALEVLELVAVEPVLAGLVRLRLHDRHSIAELVLLGRLFRLIIGVGGVGGVEEGSSSETARSEQTHK